MVHPGHRQSRRLADSQAGDEGSDRKMNTHHLTTSRTNPQFYIFSQLFGNDFSWNNCNWEGIQNVTWEEFWQREGHELLEQKWHKRFPEYKDLIDVVSSEEQGLWKELWEKHASDYSDKFWYIFSCAFENYQHYLAKSFGLVVAKNSEDVEQDLQNLSLTNKPIKSKQQREKEENESYLTAKNDPEDCDEEQQLRLLGLPTSFASKAYIINRQEKKTQYEPSCSDSEDDEDLLTMENSENEALHGVQSGSVKKNKRRQGQLKKHKARMPECMQEDNNKMVKYWVKRFSLFSRFDQGIRLDRESWFSVTPEKIAKQTARRLACDVILDAFCGCGGNAIQFANTCGRVIAVDIDAEKLAMAKHNAGIYGVAHKIEFIHADFLQFAATTKLRPNVVFLSPPWGGPDYQKQATFDIETNLLPVGASNLMQLSRSLASDVAFFLPRNANMKQVVALSGVGQQCEVEHNYLDTRMVALTAYYGKGIIKGSVGEDE
ncbi:trimethylguanosine synthase [Drosophila sechellia]|uniref:trimethylguanosine synthase n=1 Tax=Drosophila sechellia TaxID=7238 RepID=UPI0013DE69AB|nr:trimethylguanosine synthase [Drosophila sechellia]